jgi:ABC-type antimicrobial peptide transport system, ATPase component
VTASQPEYGIVTRGLRKEYHGVAAVEGLDLEVQRGEIFGLLGPNGSGKTTTLSVLGCMLTPTSGTVWVRGRSTEGASAEELAKLRRDNVGFVFQTYHLFPTLNAADNVRLALDVRGQRTKAAVVKAKDALTNVGLSHKMASYPHELSSGEQQRVAIARAIVGDVSAIFADEPTAALDTENGKAIMTILSSIAKDRSRGVLVVTHDARLMPFADRVIYLEDGRIIRKEKKNASHQ